MRLPQYVVSVPVALWYPNHDGPGDADQLDAVAIVTLNGNCSRPVEIRLIEVSHEQSEKIKIQPE